MLAFGLTEPYYQDPLVDCYRWLTYEDGLDTELEYINMVLDSVEEEYNIDFTRIYCMGHSNDAGLAITLAEYMPEHFAGFAPVGRETTFYSDVEEFPEEESGILYPLFLIAETDKTAKDYSECSEMVLTIHRALVVNVMDMDSKPVE